MDKTLWQIIKGTFIGTDGEGSAKRALAFWFGVFLTGSMQIVFEYCFWLSVSSLSPTTAQILVVKMYEPVHFSLQISTWMFTGLATIESITNFISVIRGREKTE